VIACDIRASCALVLAGLVAQGSTIMTGIHHWTRGYDGLENKLSLLGGSIKMYTDQEQTSGVAYGKPEMSSVEHITKQ
jgi:UDP-N-acetylglucosamine enolpyruvyl transferase